jgi:hypothetical protein
MFNGRDQQSAVSYQPDNLGRRQPWMLWLIADR